jgi:hypothetical protein
MSFSLLGVARPLLAACLGLVCLLLFAGDASAGCRGRAGGGLIARVKERIADRRGGGHAAGASQSCGCSDACTCGSTCPVAVQTGFANEVRVHAGPVPQAMTPCPGGVCPNPRAILPAAATPAK